MYSCSPTKDGSNTSTLHCKRSTPIGFKRVQRMSHSPIRRLNQSLRHTITPQARGIGKGRYVHPFGSYSHTQPRLTLHILSICIPLI